MKTLLFAELKRRLAEAVSRNQAEGILLSGGLDSALVAAHSKTDKAISVSLELYGQDQHYASKVAKFLHLDHYQKTVSIDEAIAAIPEVIRILKSFDPAIPNDITAYLGLKYAKDMGLESVMTGDGSDEIFAGYSYMLEMENLEEYLNRMYPNMRFSSNEIGESLGIDIRQPFLDEKFMQFAQKIDLDFKIKGDNGHIWGKWILRKAFAGVLPEEILWQSKRPLEYGSGMTEIRKIIESKVHDKEFEEAKEVFSVRFWNKEHFYYYRIYRQIIGEIPAPQNGQKACKCCGAGINQGAFHCKICGELQNGKD